ncbi:hypothetical protein [Thermoflavimicrobium daqui]|uniref:hypothetical protein n=1 Tax=Thermoflavimicrobium daqui TaxID=2137476 RepID=UPI00143D38BA|nr:hypothetical protein [Thermoflavimicrobium daqui]
MPAKNIKQIEIESDSAHIKLLPSQEEQIVAHLKGEISNLDAKLEVNSSNDHS